MSAFEIGIGVAALSMFGVVVNTYFVNNGLQGIETVFGAVSFGGVAWFIARLCGAA